MKTTESVEKNMVPPKTDGIADLPPEATPATMHYRLGQVERGQRRILRSMREINSAIQDGFEKCASTRPCGNGGHHQSVLVSRQQLGLSAPAPLDAPAPAQAKPFDWAAWLPTFRGIIIGFLAVGTALGAMTYGIIQAVSSFFPDRSLIAVSAPKEPVKNTNP